MYKGKKFYFQKQKAEKEHTKNNKGNVINSKHQHLRVTQLGTGEGKKHRHNGTLK